MTDAHLLLIGGPSGVGKSTTGWAVADELRERRIPYAHVEGDFLDAYFSDSPTDPGLAVMTERNLAALWAHYAEIGIDRLVYVNTVSVLEPAMIVRAMGGAVIPTGVLLGADEATVSERLGGREHGDSLVRHLERSRAAAVSLEREAAADVLRVPTAGRTPAELAVAIVDHWLSVRRLP